MADLHFWIQIENRPWDACPNNIDRMHGHSIEDIENMAPPINVTLTSPETGASTTRKMYLPVNSGVDGGTDEWIVKDALILRRYTENWAAPDDRKVNPWDLNEQNPTDTGTMGTIPGATLECNVGDRMFVHFRNKDFRSEVSPLERSHSLHPHGIVFRPEFDGAYPLSPSDLAQPITPGESGAWAAVGVTSGFKKGDRVPPGGTFAYTWETFGWPSTAGVWHYHDHAICDGPNVLLGARGFLVIHNPADPDDVVEQDLPGGTYNGSLTRRTCFPFLDFDLKVHPVFLDQTMLMQHGETISAADDREHFNEALADLSSIEPKSAEEEEEGYGLEPSTQALALQIHDAVAFELARDFVLARFCIRRYIEPPTALQILQYYSELDGVGMVINGRRFLGNTPTVIAGPATKMRFGVAAMNNLTFHTFHLHGHRWTIPGPDGNTSGAIQGSVQDTAVSQFEDTRLIGPANSFGFTINQGSFMGSRFTPDTDRASAIGEWHMHCHVLNHMMPGGMMGSLFVIEGGELALGLPSGQPKDNDGGGPVPNTVVVDSFAFTPNNLSVPSGTQLSFEFLEADHTVITTGTTGTASAINLDNGGGPGDGVPVPSTKTVIVTGGPGDTVTYICGIHGNAMTGTVTII